MASPEFMSDWRCCMCLLVGRASARARSGASRCGRSNSTATRPWRPWRPVIANGSDKTRRFYIRRWFADFHSNRHMFITSLERVGIRPKMAQTLARHSDVRLTLGIYTHVELHDQAAAIASLPPLPGRDVQESPRLRSFGPQGLRDALGNIKWCPLWCPRVPKLVPNASRQKGYGSHRIAPTPPTGATKTATQGSPQSQTEVGDTAPNGAKLHRFAPPRGADQ